MRIAIVDDISEDRLILRSEINAYFQEKSGDTIITFEEFPSGEALLSAFVPGHFQIVFLDIYMPGTNGMDSWSCCFSFVHCSLHPLPAPLLYSMIQAFRSLQYTGCLPRVLLNFYASNSSLFFCVAV